MAKALQSEGYTSIGLYGFCCKLFRMTYSRRQSPTYPT